MKADEAAVSVVSFCDGSVLHASQCEAGLGVDWMTAISKLNSSLRREPGVDLSSVASLAALTLVTGAYAATGAIVTVRAVANGLYYFCPSFYRYML